MAVTTKKTFPATSNATTTALGPTGLGMPNVTKVVMYDTHPGSVDNKVKLGGSDRALYRGDFIVKKINDQNSFNVSIGIGTTSPDASGTMYTYKFGYASAGGKKLLELNLQLLETQYLSLEVFKEQKHLLTLITQF